MIHIDLHAVTEKHKWKIKSLKADAFFACSALARTYEIEESFILILTLRRLTRIFSHGGYVYTYAIIELRHHHMTQSKHTHDTHAQVRRILSSPIVWRFAFSFTISNLGKFSDSYPLYWFALFEQFSRNKFNEDQEKMSSFSLAKTG